MQQQRRRPLRPRAGGGDARPQSPISSISAALLQILLVLLRGPQQRGVEAAFAAPSPVPSRLPPKFEPLPPRPADAARPRVVLHDWTAQGLTPYEQAWAAQHAVLDRRLALRQEGGKQRTDPGWWAGDRLFLLQHPPTYTLGTGSTPDNLRFDPADAAGSPAALFRTERGGEATWHGPGQIVAYPLLDLQGGYRPDLHWYLRALEEVVFRALKPLGVAAGREEGLTGVWTEKGKVAAVGVKVKRWHTMHGVALNVNPPMEFFQHIVPCGIADRPVACLADFVPGITVADVAPLVRQAFEDVFEARLVDPSEAGEGVEGLLADIRRAEEEEDAAMVERRHDRAGADGWAGVHKRGCL